MEIEKGILIPKSGYGRPTSAIWSKMEVGDSVFFEGRRSNNIGNLTRVERSKGKRFTCRTLVENGVSGVRVWRIE